MKHGYHAKLETLTIANNDFRHVLYTAEHCQLVLMSLPPGSDIGSEVHQTGDQFFRFEQGLGQVVINGTEYSVQAGDSVIVPAGAEHNVRNISADSALKLYTLYAPPHHQDGVVRGTKAEAGADGPEFDGRTSE